jgi:acyl carrier protein
MTLADKDINAVLIEALEDVAGVPAEKVSPEMAFVEDLDLDSLSMVEVGVTVQDKLGVEIPDEDIMELKTVREFVAYLENLRTNA